MTIEINLVVVAIIFAIIVIMAIIGYLVEGTNAGNKKKNKKEETKEEQVNEISVQEETPAPSAWTGEIKVEDPTHQQVHTVSTIDDWSMMPQTESSFEQPEIQTNENQEQKLDEISSAIDTPIKLDEPSNNSIGITETLNTNSGTIETPAVFNEPAVEISSNQVVEPLTSTIEDNVKMSEAESEINATVENLNIDNKETQTNNDVWK